MLDARTPALDALVRQAQRECGSPDAMGPTALAGLLEKLVSAPQLWSPSVRHEPTSRWYGSLFRDDVVDLWLLTWQQDNSTDLHDHGGSSGAFRVVSGALSEFRPALGNDGDVVLRRTVRRPGATVSFGPRLVHDVHNVDAVPAVSLHVYSPPLSSMTYYDVAGRGLSARHTEPVEV
ncbi:MAG: hypothetical protein QOC98_989, partial [Frankiaceae bacterium]|nr:hypothetical protein [Frankiaceae bacterium]